MALRPRLSTGLPLSNLTIYLDQIHWNNLTIFSTVSVYTSFVDKSQQDLSVNILYQVFWDNLINCYYLNPASTITTKFNNLINQQG